jgi:hypothetical protein
MTSTLFVLLWNDLGEEFFYPTKGIPYPKVMTNIKHNKDV